LIIDSNSTENINFTALKMPKFCTHFATINLGSTALYIAVTESQITQL